MNLTLETDRLVIRSLQEDDVALGVKIWDRSRGHAFMAGVPTPETTSSPRFSETCERSGGDCIGVWCVIEKDKGKKIGSAVLLSVPVKLGRYGLDIAWPAGHSG